MGVTTNSWSGVAVRKAPSVKVGAGMLFVGVEMGLTLKVWPVVATRWTSSVGVSSVARGSAASQYASSAALRAHHLVEVILL